MARLGRDARAQGDRHRRVPDRADADPRRAGQQPRRRRGADHRRLPGRAGDRQPARDPAELRAARRRSVCGPESTTSSATSPGILSPIITGLLIAKTGSYTPPFVLAAALIALGPLAFWLILKEVKAAPSLG